MTLFIKSILILLMILLVRKCESVYCELDRDEFYIQQADICKKCDPCPQGYGKVGIEDIDFEISPEHGATGCLGCAPCDPGKTFSASISHKQCQVCKRCDALNKTVGTPCTTISNTKCIKIRATQSTKQSSVTTAIYSNDLQEEKKDHGADGPNLNIVLGCIAGSLTVLLILIIVCYIRSKRHNRGDKKYTPVRGGSSSSSQSSPFSSTDTEVDGCPVSNDVGKQSIGTEQITLISISEKSSVEDELPWSSDKECDESDFQNICKLLGVKSEFANLGRKLGVPDVDIQLIKEQNKNDLAEQAFQTLLKWKQLKGNMATKGILYNNLLSINRKDIAQILITVKPAKAATSI